MQCLWWSRGLSLLGNSDEAQLERIIRVAE